MHRETNNDEFSIDIRVLRILPVTKHRNSRAKNNHFNTKRFRPVPSPGRESAPWPTRSALPDGDPPQFLMRILDKGLDELGHIGFQKEWIFGFAALL